MCDKAVNRCFLAFIYILDRYKTQEICDRVISEDPFMLVYCPDRYKTQRMCGEAVDDYLAALKPIPDWFATSKILEKSDNALHANDDIFFYNEDFDKVTFIPNRKHILAVDLDKINLDNNNYFDEEDPDTINYVGLLAWQHKALKKSNRRVNANSVAS